VNKLLHAGALCKQVLYANRDKDKLVYSSISCYIQVPFVGSAGLRHALCSVRLALCLTPCHSASFAAERLCKFLPKVLNTGRLLLM
jgi:hypothetical protein